MADKLHSYPLECPRAYVTCYTDGSHEIHVWDTDEENVVLSVQGLTEGQAKANFYRRVANILEQQEHLSGDETGSGEEGD